MLFIHLLSGACTHKHWICLRNPQKIKHIPYRFLSHSGFPIGKHAQELLLVYVQQYIYIYIIYCRLYSYLNIIAYYGVSCNFSLEPIHWYHYVVKEFFVDGKSTMFNGYPLVIWNSLLLEIASYCWFNHRTWRFSIANCYWLVVFGGIPTPLKNMKVSWDDDIPNIWKIKKTHGSKAPTRLVYLWLSSDQPPSHPINLPSWGLRTGRAVASPAMPKCSPRRRNLRGFRCFQGGESGGVHHQNLVILSNNMGFDHE